jgi:hypothetical protein
MSSANRDIYAPALTLLDSILPHNPQDLNYFGAFISFPSRLSKEFTSLLRRKRTRYVSRTQASTDGFRCTAFVNTLPSAYTITAANADEQLRSHAGYEQSLFNGTHSSALPSRTVPSSVTTTQGGLHTANAQSATDSHFWPAAPTNATTEPREISMSDIPLDDPTSSFTFDNLDGINPTAKPQMPPLSFMEFNPPSVILDPDPVAILILGYWFNIISDLPHWWASGRGRGESVAIVGWLRRLIERIKESEGEQVRATGVHESMHGITCTKTLGTAVEEFANRVDGRNGRSRV